MQWFIILWLVLTSIGTPQPDTPPTELLLLTHNLHAEQSQLDPMVAVVEAADADVVALQEVSQAAFDRFAAEFADRYPYRVAELAGGRWTGMALFSRYEIVDQTTWPPDEMRLIRAVLAVEDTAITVFNVHPVSPGTTHYDFDPRSRQITYLLAQAAQEPNPVILMGDFNTEEWSEDYDAITGHFVDAFRVLYPDRLGVTYPDYSHPQARTNARLPGWVPLVLRIDYIFHDPALQTIEALVWPESSGSDHRALLAVVALNGTPFAS